MTHRKSFSTWTVFLLFCLLGTGCSARPAPAVSETAPLDFTEVLGEIKPCELETPYFPPQETAELTERYFADRLYWGDPPLEGLSGQVFDLVYLYSDERISSQCPRLNDSLYHLEIVLVQNGEAEYSVSGYGYADGSFVFYGNYGEYIPDDFARRTHQYIPRSGALVFPEARKPDYGSFRGKLNFLKQTEEKLSALLSECRSLLGTEDLEFYMPDFYSLAEGKVQSVAVVSEEVPEYLLLLHPSSETGTYSIDRIASSQFGDLKQYREGIALSPAEAL